MLTTDYTFVRALGQGSQARVDLYVKRDYIPESYYEERNLDDSRLVEESKLLKNKEGKLSSNTAEAQFYHQK